LTTIEFLDSGQKAKALFDYAALAPNQINLKSGDIISLVNYGGKGSWSKGVEVATGLLLFSVLCHLFIVVR